MGAPLLWFGNAAKFLKSQLVIPGSTSGSLTVQPAAVTTDYTLTMPGTQGGSTTTLSNNGSGVLSWVTGLPAAGTDGQILKSMNSVLINSSYTTPYINYIGNAFSETNTNGWATYADAAANIPVDGTGGTATGLTFSRTTSSPLRDTGTFSIVQANSTSLQGKGVSYDFTIDSADKTKSLSIQLDFNASSTFVAGNGTTAPLNDGTTTTNAGNSDLEVFIYDVANTVLTPVSPQTFTANGANNFTFKGIFQAASNSTSYRLILHVATTSANATGWTFKFTNVYVGPQYIVQGAPNTDWSLTTGFTFSAAFGTTTNPQVFTKRVGDTMFAKGIVTTGTVAASAMSIGLPVSIDSTKLSSSGAWLDGQGASLTTSGVTISTANVLTYAFYDGSTTSSVFWANSTLSGAFAKSTGSSGASNSLPWEFYFSFPVAGWSSNVLMSNDSDTRVVDLIAYNSGGSATANTALSGFTTIKDSHGAFNGTTFTVPVSGDYEIDFYAATTTGTPKAQINKAGALYLTGVGSGVRSCASTVIPNLVAGNAITVSLDSTLTLTTSTTDTILAIRKISAPVQLATTDSINGRYFSSVTTISGSLATIVYATKGFDTSGSYNNSTGIWTCYVSGKYIFNAAIATAGTIALNNALDLQIQQSGSSSQISESLVDAAGAVSNLGTSVSDEFYCLAGDTVKVQVSSGATLPTIVSSNSKNYFSWARLGN